MPWTSYKHQSNKNKTKETLLKQQTGREGDQTIANLEKGNPRLTLKRREYKMCDIF